MSELISTRANRANFRWQLLTTVSALALLASVNAQDAKAADDDTDRPTVWIELGGLVQHVEGQGEPFTPAFLAANPNSPVLHPAPPVQAQNPVPFSFGEEGKVSFQPDNSDWVFSASVRYGRSSNTKKLLHQTDGTFYSAYKYGVPTQPPTSIRAREDFADTRAQRSESHAIMDFQAGKDVGLGMFGRSASSIFSLGVRFAQFSSDAAFDIRARPNLHFRYVTVGAFQLKLPLDANYHATGEAARGFRGVGPSLSWNASAPILGNAPNGELTFDWGVNAAILFGKQKAKTHHQSSGYHHGKYTNPPNPYSYHNAPPSQFRSRTVTVPNVGGFAGASFRIQNAKVSVGYRADFFFGAIDGGIDTRKNETLGFYGPFANVSFGIGG